MWSSVVFADDLGTVFPFLTVHLIDRGTVRHANCSSWFFHKLSGVEPPSEFLSRGSWCGSDCVIRYILSFMRAGSPFLNVHCAKGGICNFSSAERGPGASSSMPNQRMPSRSCSCETTIATGGPDATNPTFFSSHRAVGRSRDLWKVQHDHPPKVIPKIRSFVPSYLFHRGIDWGAAICKKYSTLW